MLRFQTLSRYPDIGTNSYLLEFGETRIVLDAGTHPKHPGRSTLPQFNIIEPDSLDGIIVSHPHLDHIGALPCLGNVQPMATVVMSEGTKQAGRALLHNSVNVMTALRTEIDEPDYPLYSHRQIDQQYKQWVTRENRAPFFLGDVDRVECEFFHAGHVMGAVGVQFKFADRTVFYSGDVHFEDQTLTTKAEFPTEGIDDLIIETTRGESPRPGDYTRENEKQRFGQVIADTIDQGGTVLIPVFAFGKTQEVLLMIKELVEEDILPQHPVHIGGLSSKMTAISDDHSDRPHRRHAGYKIMNEYPDLCVMPKGRSEPEFHPGHIYALSSGMMTEKTVSNRFAKHILSDPRSALIFVGYCDPESPGGIIQNTPRGEKVTLDSGGREFDLNCTVERFDFSGHATRESIVEYAQQLKPKRVILVHGDMPAKAWFKTEMERQLPDSEIIIPDPGESIELS